MIKNDIIVVSYIDGLLPWLQFGQITQMPVQSNTLAQELLRLISPGQLEIREIRDKGKVVIKSCIPL